MRPNRDRMAPVDAPLTGHYDAGAMTRNGAAAPRRLISMAALACYVILAVAATGPHAHDLAATPGSTGPDDHGWQAVPAESDAAGGVHRSGECRLCSWQRWSSPELREEATEHRDAPTASWRLDPDRYAVRDPLAHPTLLRAPPVA